MKVLDNIEDKYSNKDQNDFKTDIKEVESKCQNEKEISINKKENFDEDSEEIIRNLRNQNHELENENTNLKSQISNITRGNSASS